MALIIAAAVAVAGAQAPTQPTPPAAEFAVFLKGSQVGTVEVSVERSADRILVTGTTRLGPPLSVAVRGAMVRYDKDWRPLEFALVATVQNGALSVRTTFAGGQATSEIEESGKTSSKTDPVSPDAVVLSNVFLGAYEALAARLATSQPGALIRAYMAPQREIAFRVAFATDENVQVPSRTVATRHLQLALENTGAPTTVDLWHDGSGRLVRFSSAADALDVVRTDVATVAARRETAPRAGDEHVSVPANGFVLAATVSRPAAAQAPPQAKQPQQKLPAVVLVSGSESTDRNETVANIPVFAQMAGALADAGFLVVRYDKRGVGQSGGRIEAATIADYADDVVSVSKYLEKRKDVDNRRIALVGYGEGAWMALAAASSHGRIAAVALLAAAGSTGEELMLERQRNALARMEMPETERQARIAQQQQIHKAVLTGSGWEGIQEAVRRQADTPWFRSFLLFDPAKTMSRIRKPILILHAELDREVSSAQFQKLIAAAGNREPRQGQTVEARTINGVNHLLVPATAGEADASDTLAGRTVSRELLSTLTTWLQTTLSAPVR